MSRRDPYTLEEHDRLGGELHLIRHRLLHIGVDIARRYGKGRPVGKRALAMHQAVDALRHLIEDEAAEDLGERFDVHLYYPGTRGVGRNELLEVADADGKQPEPLMLEDVLHPDDLAHVQKELDRRAAEVGAVSQPEAPTAAAVDPNDWFAVEAPTIEAAQATVKGRLSQGWFIAKIVPTAGGVKVVLFRRREQGAKE